jgi:hypothetical protein
MKLAKNQRQIEFIHPNVNPVRNEIAWYKWEFLSSFHLLECRDFRKEVAEKVGIAFELPTQSTVVAPNAPKEVAQPQ